MRRNSGAKKTNKINKLTPGKRGKKISILSGIIARRIIFRRSLCVCP
jgi:hypothetical protein